MSIKKNSGSIGLGNYLSPADVRNVVRITKKIESAKKVEEVLLYQKQLRLLRAKAERNKKNRERMVRRRAMELKKIDREELKKKYMNDPQMIVTSAGMVDEESELSKASQVIEATNFNSMDEAVESAKASIAGKGKDRFIRVKVAQKSD